jgi:hypothetical protein
MKPRMTTEDIIRYAREAGMEYRENHHEFATAGMQGVAMDNLISFAVLITGEAIDAEDLIRRWADQSKGGA